jgi:isocitrate dehydrogenase
LADIDIVPCDISVAGRVLAAFPEKLDEGQRVPDNLSYLGDLCKQPSCNIVKLPNVSASIPQLQACITELRNKGYNVPLYPAEPKDDAEKAIQKKYASILGSAVNPVLREGNSDRRVAPPVKAYAQKNPHRMGLWSKASRTHVAHMTEGDFYSTEKSTTIVEPTDVSITLIDEHGGEKVLKKSIPLEAGEVIDASRMSVKELRAFYEREIDEAKETDILLSLVSTYVGIVELFECHEWNGVYEFSLTQQQRRRRTRHDCST